jgi:hydrogenase nickel incorporation protein HypA/HybF
VHELSIALSIIGGVEEEARRQGVSTVCAVHLRIGPLSGVVPDALRFSFDLAAEGTVCAGANLMIEEVAVRVHCSACGRDAPPLSSQCLHCSNCRHTQTEVIAGDELDLFAIELEPELQT